MRPPRLSPIPPSRPCPTPPPACGNPSSLYRAAQEGKTDLERARGRKSPPALNARPEEIYYLRRPEADNWPCGGRAHGLAGRKGGHIITSAIEHHAVLHTAQYQSGEAGL